MTEPRARHVRREAAGAISAAALLAALVVTAQTPPRPIDVPGGAILHFRARGGAEVMLKGTERMPGASATAGVEARPGFWRVKLDRDNIRGLGPPGQFGRDFLTYVVWAVTPDGTATNLGELVFEGGRWLTLEVTTAQPAFALVLTAEPDFAVRAPSPVAVLASQPTEPAAGHPRALSLPFVYFTFYVDYDTRPATEPTAGPPELAQARKAKELAARAWPTDRKGPDDDRLRDALNLADAFLFEAEAEAQRKGATPEAAGFARTAAVLAESARALAVGAAGGRLGLELEALRAQIAEARGQLTKAQRELTSAGDRSAQLEAALDRERRHSRSLETELLARREQVSRLVEEKEGSQGEAARAAVARGALCGELRDELAALGPVASQGETLVLTMAADELFETGKFDLRVSARENLARLAALRPAFFAQSAMRFEGHTDLVGDEDLNQWLSEQRALAVYRFFVEDALNRGATDEARAPLAQQLEAVDQLLKTPYSAARRQAAQRQEWLARVGHAVVGKGMREPVVAERGANEQNRRVNILFLPDPRANAPAPLCAALPGR
jgi:outer membrane protein OmpA-like peptidoglycan-associated protein